MKMFMNKYLLVFFLFFITITINAQRNKSYVVISSQLNVRQKPDILSKLVGTIENGAIVVTDDFDKFNDLQNEEINGMWGQWVSIKHNKIEGFVFSAYLGTKYMLFYEGAEIQYYPKVKNWYGVFYDSLTRFEFIKKMETFVEKAYYEDSDTESEFVRTKETEKPLFLIATNMEMKEQKVGYFTHSTNYSQNEIQLDPGTRKSLSFSSKNTKIDFGDLHLFVTGNYMISENGLSLENYQMYVALSVGKSGKYIKMQNLNNYTTYKESYELEFYGDIDGDEKVDVIFSDCANRGCDLNLLLSSEATETELLGFVSRFSFNNRY